MKMSANGQILAENRATGPRVIVGIGARACADEDEIAALVARELAAHNLSHNHVTAIATHVDKVAHPAIQKLAASWDVPVLGIQANDVQQPVPTPSTRVEALFGQPSVAEASAMAFGPLIAPKRKSANATCALAMAQLAPVDAAVSTAMASSTVGASVAGP